MRRLAAAILAPLAVTAAIAGCSSSSSSSGTANPNAQVTVSGKLGTAPTVHIPAAAAGKTLVTKTLIKGTGPVLTNADSYLARFSLYVWRGKTHKLLFTNFASTPTVLPVAMGLTGLQKAITGQHVGSRVLAVMPPKYGYGKLGNSQIGVKGTDTLVWVVDLDQAFTPNTRASGKQVSAGGGTLPTVTVGTGGTPQVAIPSNAPPSKLVVKTLIQGTGPAVQKNQSIVVRYVGVIWRTGKVFNSDWPSVSQPTAAPNVFTLGQLIPAWNTGLVGVKVGSRVMLVVPPAEGYGKNGSAQAGIKGTDTLVFVVDVLAVAS
jgi:peptidylprolyl isomerase